MQKAVVEFPDLYQPSSPLTKRATDCVVEPGPVVSLSVKEMPLTEFLRLISAQYGVAVMWSEGMDKRVVSVEAQAVPIDEVFTGLARRFGVAVERVGASWYVGEFRPEDSAIMVRRMSRLDAEGITQAVQVALGEGGRVQTFKDGLTVIAGRADNLRRVAETLDQIEDARSDSWVLQLYLFSASHSAVKELGFDTSALIDLSYTFAKESLAPLGVTEFKQPANGPHLATKFSAVMKATASREDVRLIGKPLFVLADGETAVLTSGVSVPVPKKTVSDQGTVTTSAFEYVQSGITSEATIREGGKGTVKLTLKVSLGQITGFVESAPVQAKDEFSTVAVLASSGVYLLGALDRDETRAGAAGLFEGVALKRTSDKRQTQIQVWARLYRIEGAAK